eukprot:TRINITY_DN3302_c0_g1_i2.p1 TRINITY_DN3302_c0_g1~~TRINITY_DN3302_c0_g1_i2.p1  ORF type:complete len:269 (+),score=85.78 TRINITY_DN3302_c0_g1_i2:238-1044(+)
MVKNRPLTPLMRKNQVSPSDAGPKKKRKTAQRAPSTTAASPASSSSTTTSSSSFSSSSSSLGGKTEDDFVTDFVRCVIPKPSKAQSLVESKVLNRSILLDNPKGLANEKRKRDKRKAKEARSRGAMSCKERKQKRLYFLPKSKRKYELFLPLNELWNGYMKDMLKEVERNETALHVRLSRSDFHGAIIHVVQSRCPSLVGVGGIVAFETQHLFKVITKGDEMKALPKAGSVFAVAVGKHLVTLYGNNIRFRPSERSSRRFTTQVTIEL